MIVKQVPNRHDGQSNFGALARYMTEGMDRKVLSDLAETRPGFGQLTQYVAQQTSDAGKEKCIAILLNKLLSVETAAAEFHSVASKNTDVDNPVIHLICSWPEHERPTIDQVFGAGQDVLKALNLHDHQSLMAIHGDTDNLHCHIEVSRVHPKTFKSQHLPWMHKTMHRAAREIEIKNDWEHGNGLFVVRESSDGRKFVVPNGNYRDGDALVHEPYSEKIARMTAWSDARSLVDYCRGEVAPLIAQAIDREGGSWLQVHELLAAHGMRMEKTSDKAFRLEAFSEAGDIVRLPISKALRHIKFAEVEARLGVFVSSKTAIVSPSVALRRVTETAEHEARSTARDPVKREGRRLERAAERSVLINRYRVDQKTEKTHQDIYRHGLAEVSKWRKSELAKMNASMAERRAVIRLSKLDRASKRMQYSLLALNKLARTHEIVAEVEARRAVIVAQRPEILVWRTWLEREAQTGDAAALAALRGIAYQEGREARKGAHNGVLSGEAKGHIEGAASKPLAGQRKEDAFWPDEPNRIRAYEADALMRLVQGLKWKVTNNGNVAYQREGGHPVYVDHGNKITFDRKTVTDEDLALALMHGREKWGEELVLTAGDDVFTARMVKAAVKAEITIKNPELQKMQAFFKAQKEGTGLASQKTKPVEDGLNATATQFLTVVK